MIIEPFNSGSDIPYIKGTSYNAADINGRVGYYGKKIVGVWFYPILGIDAGETVESAYFNGIVKSVGSGSFTIKIGKEHPPTSTVVNWVITLASYSVGSAIQSPDLKTVIQAIIDTAGYDKTAQQLIDFYGNDATTSECVGFRQWDEYGSDAWYFDITLESGKRIHSGTAGAFIL